MVEITYQTAIDDCRKCYMVKSTVDSSPVSVWEAEQRRRGQIRTQADLEVLTNTANHAVMDILKDACRGCDFNRPRIPDVLDPEVLARLEAVLKQNEMAEEELRRLYTARGNK